MERHGEPGLTDTLRQQLESLVGLPLVIARRAASMRVFHFGAIRSVEGGTVGQYALHLQCPWRLDGPAGIVTGQDDLWEVAAGKPPADRHYESGPNLQDTQLATVLQGYDARTSSYINTSDQLQVMRVDLSATGDIVLSLSGQYRLTVFPNGRVGEAWRFFRPLVDTPHLVFADGAFAVE